MVLRIMRLIHVVNAPEKIICCCPGEEIFFPTADKYYYNWKNSKTNRKKRGWHTSLEDKKQLISKIKKEYSDYKIIDFSTYPIEGTFNFDDAVSNLDAYSSRHMWCDIVKKVQYKLKPKINNIKTDIVLGTRKRLKRSRANWEHWNELGELLTEEGLSYSVVGVEDQSYLIDGAMYHSWQFDSVNDASVEMIQNCKLYIGVDSGITHLASFIQIPILTVSWEPKPIYMENLRDSNGKYDITHSDLLRFDKEVLKQLINDILRKNNDR